jgi:hypothetical protein
MTSHVQKESGADDHLHFAPESKHPTSIPSFNACFDDETFDYAWVPLLSTSIAFATVGKRRATL